MYVSIHIYRYTCIHTYANVANLATCGHNLCPYVIMVHHMAPCPCCTVLAHAWFHPLCNSRMLNFFWEEAIWL